MPKRSDDPGRMRQDSGFAAQNPSHSTLIASATSLSLLSNPSHQVSSFTATAAAASKAQDYSKDQDYNPTDDDRIDLLKSTKSKDGRFRILKKTRLNFWRGLCPIKKIFQVKSKLSTSMTKEDCKEGSSLFFFTSTRKINVQKAASKLLPNGFWNCIKFLVWLSVECWEMEVSVSTKATLSLRRSSERVGPPKSFESILELMKKVR